MMKTSDVNREFENESEEAHKLAVEQPRYWEYLLTKQLLLDKLNPINQGYDELERGLTFRPLQPMSGPDYAGWLSRKMSDLKALIRLLAAAFTEELVASWGAPGEPGDPIEIKRAIEKIALACSEFLSFETDLAFISPPTNFQRLKDLSKGMTKDYFLMIYGVAGDLEKALSAPEQRGIALDLVFPPLKNLDGILMELRRIDREM